MTKENMYQLLWDYFQDIEFLYDTLKEIDGKTINELTVEQYDYLQNCESWQCEKDTANNTNTEKYSFLKEAGSLVCKFLERLGICTMFLPYNSIYIELVGPSDDMDRAKLKCNLLRINNYIEELRGILLSLGFAIIS